jgi:microcystin-dependent protein
MLGNFILETANAPGTGVVNLAGSPTDRKTFASTFASAAPCFYFIDDSSQAEWGTGVFTAGSPNTLTRSVVIGNTANTASLLNFTGAVRVYNEIPAERMVYLGATGTVRSPAGTYIDSLSGGTVLGSGVDFWGATAPAGYVFAYGQALSRTTYSALFAVLGTVYGIGDGSTTFNVPDKRGRASVPADNMGGTAASRVTTGVAGINAALVGAVGGDQRAHKDTGLSVTSAAVSSAVSTDSGHSHALTGGGVYAGAGGSSAVTGAGSSFGNLRTGTDTATANVTTTVTTTVTNTLTQGVAGTAQNMPPGIVCNYIIFAGA